MEWITSALAASDRKSTTKTMYAGVARVHIVGSHIGGLALDKVRPMHVEGWIVGLRAKGLTHLGVFRHMVKNAAPTALAVMGLQLGYLLGGSILIETVFSWPGTGFLLNSAIFQRDLPLLQGSILVLALFFVVLNLLVDVLQTLLDPRIARA